MGDTVRISRSVLDAIVGEAGASSDEVCGLLLGGERVISDRRACANVHPVPARHFEIDPATLIAVHRAARAGGPSIIGYYHSHPSGDAVPSATDAAQAAVDGAVWLIVTGADLRAWRAVRDGAVHGRFDPVKLVTA